MNPLMLELPLLSLEQLLSRAAAALLVTGIHGFAVAWFAVLLGDRGPGYDGRVTLNPLSHLDIIGIAHAVFFRYVWIRPIEVDHRVLKGVAGKALAVFAPVTALLVLSYAALAGRALAITYVGGSRGHGLSAFMAVVSDVALLTAFASVVPLPIFAAGFVLSTSFCVGSATLRTSCRWLSVTTVVALSLVGVTAPLSRVAIAWWRSLVGY